MLRCQIARSIRMMHPPVRQASTTLVEVTGFLRPGQAMENIQALRKEIHMKLVLGMMCRLRQVRTKPLPLFDYQEE